ncbi:protein yibR [Salmonella enterica subsp. enterica serovar Montevideo str. USDA-ARS-USMARC-1903]|nr:protein yibR [Salmonella enterica subsp. enterica serovar Montevideo str. USDA-ARS-USMARC-1903]
MKMQVNIFIIFDNGIYCHTCWHYKTMIKAKSNVQSSSKKIIMLNYVFLV